MFKFGFIFIYFCAKISCYLFVCLLDVLLVVIASGCNVQVSFCILESWWESFHLRSWQRRTTGTWQWKDSSGNFESNCTHDIVNSVTFITVTCVDTCKLILFFKNYSMHLIFYEPGILASEFTLIPGVRE